MIVTREEYEQAEREVLDEETEMTLADYWEYIHDEIIIIEREDNGRV